MTQELLTTEELAELLRITPGAVRANAANLRDKPGGWPASFRSGRKRLYRRADVDAWIEQRIAAERGDRS